MARFSFLAAAVAAVVGVLLAVDAARQDHVLEAAAAAIAVFGSLTLVIIGLVKRDHARIRQGIYSCAFLAGCGIVAMLQDDPGSGPSVADSRAPGVDAFERHLIVSAAIWHMGDPDNPWVLQVITDQGTRNHDEVVRYCTEYLKSLEDPTVFAADLERWSRCQTAASGVLGALR